jgi:hypothetical protein
MDTSALSQRAPATVPDDRLTRALGRPLAYLVTTLLLLVIFGGTFVANPDRVAPTKDPAYYSWRTDALLTEDPQTVLEIEGAFGMFEGGYRVLAPVLGGYIREAGGVSTLRTTVILMAVLPVLVSLLLAGFAYRQRRDPLLWHAVALGSGSLMLTPPFVGYLDNVLCLVFLAASLYLIAETRRSWPARAGFFLFLMAAGFTHPTTLAFFCAVLGIMAVLRYVFRRFDLRSVIADDGPMLLTAFAAAVTVVIVWTIGIWGKSASLSESALSPPYGSDFFVDRLILWIKAMRPALNGPLLVVGIVGLLAGSRLREKAEDDLVRISILWLAPLVGIFGFLAGKAYPYYRFFNTTLAWVLLVGVGMYFATRVFLDVARRGGANYLALLGVVAIVAIVATNFTKGIDVSGWNNANGGWLSTSEKVQLDSVRATLDLERNQGRPVVFVIDDEPARDFQIWGFTKLSGNTSRYGMPEGELDNAYLYLGSLENYLEGEPTLRDQETYDMLSPALLEDAEAGIDRVAKEPVVVVTEAFNPAGENTDIVAGDVEPTFEGAEVWVVAADGSISHHAGAAVAETPAPGPADKGGILTSLTSLLGFLVLLLPGLLALRFFLTGVTFPEALGMVPALSMVLLGFAGMVVLAVLRSPFSTTVVWGSVVVTIAIAAFLRMRASSATSAAPAQP